MKKPSRFAANLFRSLRDDDPILDPAADEAGSSWPPPASPDVDPFADDSDLPAAGDGSPLSFGGSHPSGPARPRDYVVNSIFAPPPAREEPRAPLQQLHYVKEQDGILVGLPELNTLLRQGWRVVDAYATGNSAFFKALVLLERQS